MKLFLKTLANLFILYYSAIIAFTRRVRKRRAGGEHPPGFAGEKHNR